jgi:hypothetical protein
MSRYTNTVIWRIRRMTDIIVSSSAVAFQVGAILKEHWEQPDWIDEIKETTERNKWPLVGVKTETCNVLHRPFSSLEFCFHWRTVIQIAFRASLSNYGSIKRWAQWCTGRYQNMWRSHSDVGSVLWVVMTGLEADDWKQSFFKHELLRKYRLHWRHGVRWVVNRCSHIYSLTRLCACPIQKTATPMLGRTNFHSSRLLLSGEGGCGHVDSYLNNLNVIRSDESDNRRWIAYAAPEVRHSVGPSQQPSVKLQTSRLPIKTW